MTQFLDWWAADDGYTRHDDADMALYAIWADARAPWSYVDPVEERRRGFRSELLLQDGDGMRPGLFAVGACVVREDGRLARVCESQAEASEVCAEFQRFLVDEGRSPWPVPVTRAFSLMRETPEGSGGPGARV
jgi:hypothetical protein